MRSDLDLASQIGADGATWLDRQLVARTPVPLGENGFGAEVRDALAARAERLIEHGLAKRDDGRFEPARDLLRRLRGHDLEAGGERRAQDRFAATVESASVRRGFLKGLGVAKGCRVSVAPPPAR